MSEAILSEILEELRSLRAAIEKPQTPDRLLTAEQLAEALGTSASYIYTHAERLGAVRLPSGGSRPRLRFDLEQAKKRFKDPEPKPRAKPRRSRADADLLEIRGERP
jgi:hypothetical protein